MKQIISFFRKANIFYIAIILLLIMLHTFFDAYVKIDNTSVLLVLILLFLPYLPLVKRIKYGDFEAEITREEVEKIEEKVEERPTQSKKTGSSRAEDIKELGKRDPHLALAKVRIQIEQQLRLLRIIYISEKNEEILSLQKIVEELQDKKILDDSMVGILEDIIDITDRVIQGGTIEERNVDRLIDTSLIILGELEYAVIDHALKSGKSEKINRTEMKEYDTAIYTVTTIIPIERNPKKITYTMNRVELEEFLAGYDSYIEYIVELKKIDKKSAKSDSV